MGVEEGSRDNSYTVQHNPLKFFFFKASCKTYYVDKKKIIKPT